MRNVFKEIYEYRELLKTSVKKEIRGRYKNSFLGVIWSFLNPLLQIMVYAIVFPLILRNTQENYVIFLCCGLIPWTFFATGINRSAFTIIENGNIVKKVFFPREILPISVITSEAVNFMISTIIILAFVIFGGLGITKYIVFYPLILIVQYFLVLGISFIISSITVYLRDIQHFIGVLIQLLFYAAPVVYSPDVIPDNFKWILKLNPMTYIINAYRDVFYNQVKPDLIGLGEVFGISVLICVIGQFIFNKLQKGFAEQL
ncbi:MAG: ABC transporter permease [Clostridia bacterium]|nr:ABC transporter permease [Clostridia bacterium]